MQEALNPHRATLPKPGEEEGFLGGKMKGEVGVGSEVMGLCFSSFWGDTHIHAHSLCSGPLGPKEMSARRLIQPPVPVLMMASTCCFNVTAGSPSIPHWLWLPSPAGSSPLHTPPSSSAISASFISLHLGLLPLISTTVPLSYPSPCYTSFSTHFLQYLRSPALPYFFSLCVCFLLTFFSHQLLQCRVWHLYVNPFLM